MTYREFADSLKDATSYVVELTQELAQARSERDGLASQKTMLFNERQSLAKQRDVLRQHTYDQDATIRDLRDELEASQANTDKQHDMCEELRSKVDALQVDRDNYRVACDIKNDAMQKQWSELDELRSILSRTQQKLIETGDELRDANARIEFLKQGYESATRRYHDGITHEQRAKLASDKEHQADLDEVIRMRNELATELQETKDMLEIVRGELHEERSTNPSATVDYLRARLIGWRKLSREYKEKLEICERERGNAEYLANMYRKYWMESIIVGY
jgi:chromosome segregation ATPase